MAKNPPSMAENEATPEASAVTAGSAVAAPVVSAPTVGAPVSDSRSKMVTFDAGDGQGPKQYRRKDLILKWWGEGVGRGAIAKALGCTYQIVFAATKGIAGGPEKASAAIQGTVIQETAA